MTETQGQKFPPAFRIARAALQAVAAGVSLEDANLIGIMLTGVHLRNRNFDSADFSYGYLRGAYFHRCSFKGAKFVEADLRHVVFDNCDMRGVDLTGAILIGTDFAGSDTHGSTGGEPTLVIRGPRHSVVATPSKISIGCAHGDMQKWLDYYRVIGAERGYNLADVAEYGSILRDVGKLYGDGGLFGARWPV